jgi:hypothetical protein
MKTPWNKLLQYGTGIAAIIVMAIAGMIMMAAVAIAVVATKISLFIK